MPAILPLLLAAWVLSACAAARPSVQPTPPPSAADAMPPSHEHALEAPRWFHAPSGSPHAVVLLLHGLNLKPSKMDFLARRLAHLGLDCYRPVLTGHDGDLEAFKHVTRLRWQEDVARAYAEAVGRARQLQLPLHLVGFSLGGLLGIDFMEMPEQAPSGVPAGRPAVPAVRPEISFDRMVLFAPAVAPKLFARLTWFLSPFPSLVLPSAAPEDYRVHRGTPIAAYRSVMDSANAVAARVDERTNRPTLVFVDRQDELLSASALAHLLERKRLTRWSVVEVSTHESTLEKPLHHLIIDDRAVGAAQWSRIEQLIQRHLRPGQPRFSTEAP